MRRWRRHLIVTGVACVGLLGAAVLWWRSSFQDASSGTRWKLVSRLPAAEGTPDFVADYKTDGTVLVRFVAFDSTGGITRCQRPVVRLKQIRVEAKSVGVKLDWRERGCRGDRVQFGVLITPQEPSFLFSWRASAEGPCAQFEVSPAGQRATAGATC